ncbi:putative regulatory protein (CxxC_CxxC_SSSS) [uncultured Desulfobacterium sp.]|uniref:Putative regulatory protein (CxxC_CxxC_SSSS) n=1 Tax=uncultured Desulfobacterium sp. TaxID=201089 RepID=A0A445MXR3_9BACT|nr:putative regulatory protein (CxxC_CxxC_SSSS) [uncultured Desulfobacterium sp.]
MPIYEYACEKCGNQTEVIQKFSDPPITECDVCHGKLKKLISNSTFHLKGSGWYVTDYASKGSSCAKSGRGEKSDGPSDSATTPKVEAKGGADSSSKGDSTKKGSD